MSEFLRDFARRFCAVDRHNLGLLDELYSEDVHFTDPLHEVHGLPAVRRYFADLYSNVSELAFDFHGFDPVRDGEGYLRWHMSYRHSRLAGGKPIHVEGCSHLLWHEKVYRHRDYFDAGALLYDHLPLLGWATAWLKRRMA
ncbi:nuclear transport factor 2 family protein [Pseudomonas asplenii]|uniref:nuclear transport factor 2 family protein n=1 Tax=Pseudomonas asplenii TaxID=53407 RepID=UPI002360344B|nr:nuclear transport factor 2 family protein [Pseudomonas asplenii]